MPLGTTPFQFALQADTAQSVEFRLDGYENRVVIVSSSLEAGWLVLDIFPGLFLGIIPLVVDAATGNWKGLATDHVHASLTALSGFHAPAPGQAQTPVDAAVVKKTGTAFLVDHQFVLTALHVVENARLIVVYSKTAGEIRASVVASDHDNDVCLLRLEKALDSRPLTFATAGSLETGAPVYLLGFPLQSTLDRTEPTIGHGVVSSLWGLGRDVGKFQHDAPTNPGNSGGPLLDSSGHVVGVLLSSLNPYYSLAHNQGVPQGVNFAIKSDVVLALFRNQGAEMSTESDMPSPLTAQEIFKRDSESVMMVYVEAIKP